MVRPGRNEQNRWYWGEPVTPLNANWWLNETLAYLIHLEQTGRAVASQMDGAKQLAGNIEQLASSAEESSSSILEMTATNAEVADNMSSLGASVRETASGLEEPRRAMVMATSWTARSCRPTCRRCPSASPTSTP